MSIVMRALALAFVLVLPLAASAQHAAREIVKGDLLIAAPWSRATPQGAAVAGGYVTITNKGTSADRLVSFSTNLAGQPEIHEMKEEGGIMKMRPLKAGLAIPPGATVKLEPGGYHLMLLQLKQPLVAGQRFKATLVFEKAGPVEVEFEVREMGAGQHKGKGGHHGH
jgi:copper(I)-binding protein